MTTGADPPPGAPGQLVRDLTYFEYQRLVGREVLTPWLASRVRLDGLFVGDFGAHQGGMVDALRESELVQGAIGLELSQEVVASSPFVADDRFRLEVADVMSRDTGATEFGLVLLHDVLEHIPRYESALEAVADSLKEHGHAFVSFPPYYAAFGGHQQLARGRVRLVPFVHLLPAALFFRLARPDTKDYMSADGALADMVSVRQTRLTLSAAERAFVRTGFEIVDRELFLVRPEYTVRYGMKTRIVGALGRVPLVREALVNGGFYLLRRGRYRRAHGRAEAR